MAQIDNPKKSFQFGIISPGLNPYTVQEADIPDHEIEMVEHGDTDHDIKTAGRVKYGNFKLSKLRPLNLGDNWIWDWIQSIRNTNTGGGLLASQYKRTFSVVQYSYDNITVTDRWQMIGAWPTKINSINMSRTKSENVIEEIEFSVDRTVKVL